MHFDLADLRLFIHIAESPSLTQGARRAFLSPAAASARVAFSTLKVPST
ncbi:LysR family transcriptional regulator, partial [Pseudomonas aeruginosa]|nr:LysR family transcriptional regulator [Pseudomonas aeruginosa]